MVFEERAEEKETTMVREVCMFGLMVLTDVTLIERDLGFIPSPLFRLTQDVEVMTELRSVQEDGVI